MKRHPIIRHYHLQQFIWRTKMKLLKRTLSLALSTILLFSLFLSNVKTNVYATPNTIASPFKVAVFLYSFDDLYLSHTKKNLEEIQKENPSKVEYTFLMQSGIKVFKMKALIKRLKRILTFLL